MTELQRDGEPREETQHPLDHLGFVDPIFMEDTAAGKGTESDDDHQIDNESNSVFDHARETVDEFPKEQPEKPRLPKCPHKNTYPREYKEMIVNYILSGEYTQEEVQRDTRICKKNIERWTKCGVDRKKGAGRKTLNPRMERQLIDWVRESIRQPGQGMPKRKQILDMAREYQTKDFKASKGWCDKFLKRNRRLFQEEIRQTKRPS